MSENEKFELDKLIKLNHRRFKKDQQMKTWLTYKKSLQKKNFPMWIYYFEINETIYIVREEYSSNFGTIYNSVKQEFPFLYSMYNLKVKELTITSSKVFCVI